MSNHWIDPTQCDSLAVLVESVAGKMLIQHQSPICLELDIDTSLPVPADKARTCDLLTSIIRQSLDEMVDGGDLTIIAIDTGCGIELEIADTGRDISNRAQSRPMAAAAVNATLRWQNCPQGGGSVTIAFPPEQRQRRMAA
ncbi:hypothetical protein Pla22_06280 [Rubripirellula amarantea]|uniref:Uncharacterized protein n=1 Tax=Rubripirellula amarantea TaxID=2527999 RepID=A0A5C5WRB4_9BACT|nr:ATPase [Rubripirellula amarantea]TWT53000.1 hypothetical protein Pla22_06280 [Rubripirellula amarantea]